MVASASITRIPPIAGRYPNMPSHRGTPTRIVPLSSRSNNSCIDVADPTPWRATGCVTLKTRRSPAKPHSNGTNNRFRSESLAMRPMPPVPVVAETYHRYRIKVTSVTCAEKRTVSSCGLMGMFGTHATALLARIQALLQCRSIKTLVEMESRPTARTPRVQAVPTTSLPIVKTRLVQAVAAESATVRRLAVDSRPPPVLGC